MKSESKPPKPLSKKHKRVLDEYLVCFVQWKAYKVVYPDSSEEVCRTSSSRLFADANFQAHLQARLNEAHMSADEALKLQAEIARGDVGVFFKVVDEWMFNPLPEYEILDEKEVVDKTQEPPVKRISYRVRHVVLDMDKVIDPRYSHLIHKFSNTRKNGVSIETYDKQTAIRDVLKIHGKFKDGVSLNLPEGLTINVVKASDAASKNDSK